MNDLALILAVVVPTVLFGVWWVLRSPATATRADDSEEVPVMEVPVMVFRDGVLDYASDAALLQYPIAMGAHNWEDIQDILLPQFPDFPDSPPADHDADITALCKGGSGAALRIRALGGAVSIAVQGDALIAPPPGAMEELELLRQVNRNLPHPVWKTEKSGAVVWQNEAYAALAARFRPNNCPSDGLLFKLPPLESGQKNVRAKLEDAVSGTAEWFDVTRKAQTNGTLHYATSLDTLIRAENAQRDFVQTLAKTFAHLSIGLAIFNRDRQLALFNPALTDLTGLSASFLSPRPTIDSFFDALRENRRMPEPKNYKTWRHRMADLVSAAEHGKFEETWSLESGQTYRVKGRPHPDGAIAFLIEDISAEISLTRNFRAELELGQNLADTFEDALAVFSRSGILTFSNKAYDVLWGFENQSSFADVTIVDAIRLWKEKSAPNPMWPDLQEAVMSLAEREAWSMPVCLKGQSPMQCNIVPIASGATVVRFSRQQAPARSRAVRQKKISD